MLSESVEVWEKEMNLILWDDGVSKYNISDGPLEHEKMGKGSIIK